MYLQPFVFIAPVVIRLYAWNLEILYILIAIVYMYKVDTTICDILFVLCCLMLNFNQVFMYIKNLFFMLVFILVPLSLSSIMLHLWVDVGTANANYFFFQMLIMWTSYTLLVVRYAKVLARKDNQCNR